MSHGTGLYRSSVQVPLLILMPGDTVPERQVAVPVSLRDLPMTILALLGRSDRPFPGESFAGLVRGDSGVRIHQPVASVLLEAHRRPPWPDLISIIADTMHLIRSNLAEPLLFHFERDPLELHEVGTGPGGGAAADRLGRIADSVLDITRP